MSFNPNQQFTKLISSEQLDLCNLVYDMIRTTYSQSRIITSLSDIKKEIEFTKNSMEEQAAVVDYIIDNIKDIHPDDAILICHLMFGIYMMEQVDINNMIGEDAKHIMEDCVVMVLRKYNDTL